MRSVFDENINFWKMKPFNVFLHRSSLNGARMDIFYNVSFEVRMMSDPGKEYVLGSDRGLRDIEAHLPAGRWEGNIYNVIDMHNTSLGDEIRGNFNFSLPDSRAVFVHFKRIGE
jgi:hypothetical protein